MVSGLLDASASAQGVMEPLSLPDGIELTGDTLEVISALVWAEENRQRQPQEAERTAMHALSLARLLGYDKGLGQSLTILGHITDDLDHKESYYRDALYTFEGIKDARWVSLARMFLGQAYSDLGYPERALQLYLRALEEFDRTQDIEGQMLVLGSIGNTHREQDNLEKSLTYQRRAATLAESHGSPQQLIVILANLGATLSDLREYQQAKSHYVRALLVAEETELSVLTAQVSTSLANLLISQNRYEEALPHLLKAEGIGKATGEASFLAAVYASLGDVYLRLEEYDQALRYARRSLALAQETGLYQMHAHTILSSVYEAIGDHARALDHYRRRTAIKDSVLDSDRTAIIAEMQSRYETEESRRAIERLEQENQIQSLRASRRQTLLLAGLSGLVLLLGFLYSRFRLKQRANQLLGAEKEKIRTKALLLEAKQSELQSLLVDKELLLKEVHHRVKNNLQIISSLLDLQVGILDDPLAISTLKETQGRVQSMTLVHRKLYREEHVGRIDVQEYLEELCRFLHSAYRATNTRYRVRAAGVQLDADTAIPFGLIIAELVVNALKHAFPGDYEGEITVSVRRSDSKTLELQVADNGVGLSVGNHHIEEPGIGMTLVEDLVRQLNGTIHMENGHGMTYSIRFQHLDSEE